MKRSKMLPLLLLALTAGACSKKPQAVAPATVETDAEATRRATAEAEERARREAEETRRREAERAVAALEQIIFFDYDSDGIRADSRALLDAKLPALRANPTLKVRIEGHADERGSSEYNLALGMRRANATRAYLTGFGIDASRLETTSYGEEKPMERGEGEESWSVNRRAEFRILR